MVCRSTGLRRSKAEVTVNHMDNRQVYSKLYLFNQNGAVFVVF